MLRRTRRRCVSSPATRLFSEAAARRYFSNQAIGQILREAAPRPACRRRQCKLFRAKTMLLLRAASIGRIYRSGYSARRRRADSEPWSPIRKCRLLSTIKGCCHVYVDADASLRWQNGFVLTPKSSVPRYATPWRRSWFMRRLRHNFLPPLIRNSGGGCGIRGCEKTQALVPGIKAAGRGLDHGISRPDSLGAGGEGYG